MTKRFQVVGIGNAIVDVLAHCSEEFLEQNDVQKGIMQLIDTDRSTELYGKMGPAREISGGSAANTIAGLAALGLRTAYVGKVKDDQLGEIFSHDIRAQGATYETPLAPADHEKQTGRCMVLVTPDGERSMNTYLGVSEHLTPDDIDEAMMADTDWIYLEGYRFDGPESHQAFAKAISACKAAGGKVSLTLSDPFCVDRHRDAFKTMIHDHVDLLFCNEHEIQALYEVDTLDEALAVADSEATTVACTIGERGVYVLREGELTHADAEKLTIADATGAGDMFASGYFYGLLAGKDQLTSARMGCVAAAEILGHLGARPEADLKDLFARKGLV